MTVEVGTKVVYDRRTPCAVTKIETVDGLDLVTLRVAEGPTRGTVFLTRLDFVEAAA